MNPDGNDDAARAARFAEGDAAVAAFEHELADVVESARDFAQAVARITAVLTRAAEPWNLKGDDRVLSKLTTAASSALEELLARNLDGIAGMDAPATTKKEQFEALRALVETVHWLPKGFRASMLMNIAFAVAEVRMAP